MLHAFASLEIKGLPLNSWMRILKLFSRDAALENGLVNTVGEGGTGTNGGISIDIHTLPWVR